MKNQLKVSAVILGAALLCLPLMAAKKKKETQAPAMDPAMMEKWKMYSTPGEAHAALNPLVGSFNHTMKWWMEPGAKPEESTGTTDAQWVMGGRFVESVVKGTSMGQPFEGRGLLGYDNEKKQYTGVWVDNMATGMMISTGQYDAATKTLTEQCTASCPMEHTKNFRSVTKFTDANSHSFEMYTNDKKSGKEFLMMKIDYVRKAS